MSIRLESVKLSILKMNPPKLLVSVVGVAPTSGWNGVQLVLREETNDDGIYEFDLLATPPGPDEVILHVETKVYADYIFDDIPSDLRDVLVHTKTHSLTKSAGVDVIDDPSQPILETIMGLDIVGNKLKLRVASGGCTKKEDFRINVIRGFTGLPPFWMEVLRLKPDNCEAFIPDGIVLEYNLSEELELAPNDSFVLLNKMGKVFR